MFSPGYIPLYRGKAEHKRSKSPDEFKHVIARLKRGQVVCLCVFVENEYSTGSL